MMTEEVTKRPTRGRKKQERVPISGQNDPLEVTGKDDNFHYKWVLDESDQGTNIRKHKRAGYEFVQRGEVGVANGSVYSNEHVGSHIRVSAGRTGGDLYLMKLPMEYREEDLKSKAVKVNETEESLTMRDQQEGRYGKVKISRD